MFYCEPCRLKNEWPEALTISYGPCELCKQVANCYDRPSSRLPVKDRAGRRAVEVVMPGSFAEVDAVAEREKGRLMPTLPMRVSFRAAILMILNDGKERAESEVMSYFAPEDHGGAASTLVKLADEGGGHETRGVKRGEAGQEGGEAMNGFDAEKIAKDGEVWLLDGKPHRIIEHRGSKVARPLVSANYTSQHDRSLASNLDARPVPEGIAVDYPGKSLRCSHCNEPVRAVYHFEGDGCTSEDSADGWADVCLPCVRKAFDALRTLEAKPPSRVTLCGDPFDPAEKKVKDIETKQRHAFAFAKGAHVELSRCPICRKPAHAGETDEDGVHPACAGFQAPRPARPRFTLDSTVREVLEALTPVWPVEVKPVADAGLVEVVGQGVGAGWEASCSVGRSVHVRRLSALAPTHLEALVALANVVAGER